MALPIPIIDSVLDAGKTILDKLFMDKGEKEKIEITKAELKNNFELALKQMDQNEELTKLEQVFKEHQAQRQFANDQFGTIESLKELGWVGKVIAMGRASIRWVITGGSMIFTWKILNLILTKEVVVALSAGTLSGGGTWLITLLIVLVIGIPVFYVSGISIEKILKVRNKI